MKLRRLVQTAHRWLALLLVAQIVIWMASGVVMSWLHTTLVRGETNALVYYPPELEARSYASPGGAIAQIDGVKSVELHTFLDRPAYYVTGAGEAALFDALTGKRISPISEETARKIARRDFVGEGDIAAITLTQNPPPEYRGETPVWQAVFDDKLETRLYISPSAGKIVARRNKVWRLYDFFWMLHIMDYGERQNFNNPLIRAASATGLLFALTGLFLVGAGLVSGRYRDDLRRRAKAKNDDG